MDRSKIKVLVACEYSGTVRDAFLELGFDAWSCDILPCESDIQDRHYEGDVFDILDQGWDLMIGHPPCTHLSVSGARWFTEGKKPMYLRDDAIEFVKKLMEAPIKHIAIENPISVISSQIRKPNQIVQPYMFGDSASKQTCLWTKNLPLLEPTKIVDKGEFFEWTDKNGKKKRQPLWYYNAFINSKSDQERRTLRSKTFPGIAKAIATQYSEYIINLNQQ